MTPIHRIAIVGTGDLGRIAFDILHDMGWVHHVHGFITDDPDKKLEEVDHVPVLGSVRDHSLCRRESISHMVLALDNPLRRKAIFQAYHLKGVTALTVIHDTSEPSSTASVDSGTIIYKHSVIYPSVIIGAACSILSGASVGMGTKLGDFVTIRDGGVVGAHVVIGDGAVIGERVCILSGAHIAPWSIIAPGALITSGGIHDRTVMKPAAPKKPTRKK